MSYSTEGIYGVETRETMLDLLKNCQIFSVEQDDKNGFCITERCDDYFSVSLTKEQILALAQELIQLANGG